ncbi:Imm32 family immunity protein [Thermogemmatispora sp.]|uniref:Imm32 family immunity protein n=1 Tax=Thermogemmatispora sp. TaxID=1968838 RepID=UPI0035E400BD
MILTVEYNAKGFVEIYMDEEGRRLLIDSLRRLRAQESKGDHDHLMTPSWAGNELTEEKQGDADNELIHQLNIILLPKRG